MFQSLQFKVAAAVTTAVLLISTLHFLWGYSYYKEQLLEEATESANQISELTLDSLLELAMLAHHPESLQKAIENLSSSSAGRTVRLINRKGVVRYSSDTGEIGLRSDEMVSSFQAGEVSELPSRAQVGGTEGEILRFVSPIPNRSSCRGCHDARDPTLGALVVDFSIKPIQSKIRADLRTMLFPAVTYVLAVLVVLGLLLNRIVISPVRRMTAASDMIGRKLPPPSLEDLEGGDEVGRLASSIRAMAEKLQRNCEEIQEKERIRDSLLKRLVETQEAERLRISRELHDEFGQSLSALLLTLKAPASSDGPTLPEDARHLAETRVRQLIDQVQRLAWEMRPSILDDYGLGSALERYLQQVSRHSGFHIDYQCVGGENGCRLPSDVETTLYRVAQEAVTNIIRHSKASESSVILMRKSDEVTLLIEDNGIGFDYARVRSEIPGGLGLRGMEERVTLCHGELTIESALGRGTTVRVRIPFEE